MVDDRCKPHQSASSCGRCTRWESGHGPHKRGLNSKIHLAVDAHGMPIRMFITAGTVADCAQAQRLVEGIDAENLLADKGYDSGIFAESLEANGVTPVIPPRKGRKAPRDYDKHLYRLRHPVENAFLELKRWRGVATRYAKNTSSFLAAVHIRCIAIWTKII
ncbi:IS5 family transposase [Nitratidesulfovibrio termitidis]|uniref:IS5 family transposase n=1 Tax=Nitratidesulfovibrio termitidis TaxID=42252 RepID=UPI002481770C|nr:IS5 family transposase [Nitratidesulfovibrio termitidis]